MDDSKINYTARQPILQFSNSFDNVNAIVREKKILLVASRRKYQYSEHVL